MSEGPDGVVDGGFDDSQVLTPEQLAELLAGLPQIDETGQPALPHPGPPGQQSRSVPRPARSAAEPMIGFVDGPTAVPASMGEGRSGPGPDRRPDPTRPPERAQPALDPDAAASLSWLFR